jgi:hypothetical protein
MGASLPLGVVAKAALAAGGVAAVVPGAVAVAGGVARFFNDPTVGPGWATGHTTQTGRTSLAKQLASAQAMIRNSGVPPTTP